MPANDLNDMKARATMNTINKLAMLTAAAATLSLMSVGGAAAHGSLHGPGSSHNPIVFHPVHGPGSSHNPIVFHPVHGPGSSHNPIVCLPKHPYCGTYPGGLPGRPGGPT